MFKLGNTLELLYIGGIAQKSSIIPLYIDFKSKKCHSCMAPIINYRKAIFCSNIFIGLDDLDLACYKFFCKSCLGDDWTLYKNGFFYKCPCCLGRCPPNSICNTFDLIRNKQAFFIEKEIFYYHWRGKRRHIRGKIT